MAASVGSRFAGTYVVTSGLFTVLPPIGVTHHCATVHGRTLPSIFIANVGEPFGIVICNGAVMLGGARFVAGVVMVKSAVFEGPVAFDTVTFAVPGNAASCGKMEAVSWPELTNVVARLEPFQFTTDELSKFAPVTVSVNPVAPQYGVAGIEVVDAESAAIVGAEPDVGLMVKFTKFDTSVVVVAVVPDAPETAEPGICTAT
jgi:hypothetical protein